MAVEVDHVEAFVAIVRRGGFTRAASALHLSQPAVSRRVELLEREVGRPLFDRTRGGARLTEAGRAFLPHAEALLASVHDGLEAVRALERTDRGTVMLALVGTLASTALTGRLRHFRRRHPGIRLLLHTALNREVSALVRRGDATLGLRYFPDPDPELISIPLYRDALVTVCSPNHRLAPVRRPTVRMLTGQTWVAFPVGQGNGTEGLCTDAGRAAGGARAPRGRDHHDRQPHRAKTSRRGGLWPGPHAGKRRARGAAPRHAARAEAVRDAARGAGRADPSAPRVFERRRARRHRAAARGVIAYRAFRRFSA